MAWMVKLLLARTCSWCRCTVNDLTHLVQPYRLHIYMFPIKVNGGYENGTVKAVLGSLQNLLTVSVSPGVFLGFQRSWERGQHKLAHLFRDPFHLVTSKNRNLGRPTPCCHNQIGELSGVLHVISV